MRSEEPLLPHPGAVLEAAERAGRLCEVGRLVRSTVARTIHDAPQDWLIFVNLHPSDLSDPALYVADAPLSGAARQVVLEITERASLESIPDVSMRVAQLREMGFRITLTSPLAFRAAYRRARPFGFAFVSSTTAVES